MFKDLETERLLLKCISYDDADFFYKEFSNDEVNRYLYDAEPCVSIEEAKEVMCVKKIYAHIYVDNMASIKTALKQGFMKTGENYFEEFHGEKYLHDVYCLHCK